MYLVKVTEMTRYELNVGNKTSTANSTVPTLPVAYELELHRLIELTAYLSAEKDGFRRSPLDYWLKAENEVQQFP